MRVFSALFIMVAMVAIAGQASAQNLVVNPSFEDLIGTEWTLVETYTQGTGFAVKEVNTNAPHTGTKGVAFQVPTTNNFTCLGYFKQVVSGLTPGATYNVSAWVKFDGWNLYNRPDKYWAFFKAIGGSGTLAVPAKNTNVRGYTEYSGQQTADGAGTIELQVGMDKYATTSAKECAAFFDDVSLTSVPEPGSMVAVLSGLVALAGAYRRRK